jgi:hypothetical protein
MRKPRWYLKPLHSLRCLTGLRGCLPNDFGPEKFGKNREGVCVVIR